MERSAFAFTAFPTTGEARSVSVDISLNTSHTSELIDITEQIRALVDETDIVEGMALVSTPHTTCAVMVNEAEPGFIEDFRRALDRLAPSDEEYAHNSAPHAEEFEAPNGHAHIRAAFLSSSSAMLPIRDGALTLGRWQRVFFVELDRARPRTCHITLVGRA